MLTWDYYIDSVNDHVNDSMVKDEKSWLKNLIDAI